MEEEKVFTKEELDQKKDEMLKFYTDSVAYLEAQFKYESLLMQIDEVRMKRTMIQLQYAQLMNSQEEEPGNNVESNQEMFHDKPKERVLKKV